MRANSTKTFFIERCTILVCLILVFSSTKAATITSAATGNWTVAGTWVGGVPPGASDNVIIAATHTVTFNPTSDVTILDLTVTGTFTKTAGQILTCNSLVLNGTINGASNKDLQIGNAAGSTLSGTGTFAMTSANLLYLNNVTISAGSDLLFNANGDGDFNGRTITNNGRISYIHPSRMIGPATFINNTADSYVKYHFEGTGWESSVTLISTAVGNTVEMGCLDAAPWNCDIQNSYYNLIISGTAPMKLQNPTTIAGNLTITGTAELASNGNDITIAGNWTSWGAAAFTEGTRRVTFNGSTNNQTINTTGGETFYNLTINNTNAGGSVTAASNVAITSTLTMTAGIFDIAANTLSGANLTATGGDLRLAKLSTILPELTGTYNVTGGTITFSGAGAQTIRALNAAPANYYHIVLGGSGTKTLGGNIQVKGNWSNSGATLDAATNTVTFNGTGTQTITKSASPPEIFTNVTSNTTGPITLGSNVTVTNLLTMTAGNYNLDTYTLQLGDAAASTLTRTAGIMYNSTGGAFKRYWPSVAITSGSGNYYGLFPVGAFGDGVSPFYRPVTINSTANPGVGYLSVSHTDANTTTDVSIPGVPGTVARISDQKSVITNFGIVGGTFNLDVAFSALSTTGAYADMRLVVPVTGGLGTHVVPTVTAINNPTGERDALTIGELANTWVLGTVNTTTTPLWEYFYSTGTTSGWNTGTTWSLSSTGAPNCGCVPTSSGYVVIRTGNTVTVDAPAPTVGYVDIQTGGILNGTANLTVTYDLTTLAGTGYFGPSTGAWTVNRNVLLNAGSVANVTAGGSTMTIANNLTISSGAALALSGALTLAGNLIVNNTFSMAGNNLTLSGSGKTISGSSNIVTSGGSTITLTNNKTIVSGTALTIGTEALPITLALSAATTVTNNGSITLGGSITGTNATTSDWTHNTGSTLNITGTLLTTGSLGELNVSTATNTVNYNGTGAQTIKVPTSSYHNLTASNAGTKSLGADLTVDNLVSIQNAAILTEAAAGNDLVGAAGLSMTGASEFIVINSAGATLPELTGVYTLSAGTVTINGSAGGGTTIAGVIYYNLNLIGSGNHTCSSITSITNNLIVSATVDIVSNADLTVGGAITYSSTDADGWTLTNNVTAATFTMTAVGGQINADTYTIRITGSTWTNNSTDATNFAANTGTVQFTDDAAQTISGATTTTFNNLTINNTSTTGVTLARPITTTATLTLTDGYLYTDATNLLTMAAGSSVSPAGGSAASFVDGPIAKAGTTAFVFPVGNGTRWARVAIGAPTASSTFQAQYTAAPYTDASTMAGAPLPVLTNVSTMEHWLLDRTVGAGDATVTLYWEDANFSGITDCSTSDLRVAHWNGSAWENNNESVTTTGSCGGAFAGSVSTTAVVTAFSPFSFGSKGANALPIELSSFNCSSVQNGIKLEWVTASEINNDYFTIERSQEFGVGNWEQIGTVNGAGNSSSTLRYEFIDHPAEQIINLFYYRLKQTDRDGKSETFPDITSCELTNNEQQMLLYPNPTTASSPTYMDVPSELIGKEILVVATDMLGNETYSKVIITNQQWKGIIAIDPSAKLKKGIYLITASSLNKVYKHKLVIE